MIPGLCRTQGGVEQVKVDASSQIDPVPTRRKLSRVREIGDRRVSGKPCNMNMSNQTNEQKP
jgi:hypothetical protein